MARKRTDLNVSAGVGVPARRTIQRRARHAAPAADPGEAMESQPAEAAPAFEHSRSEIALLAYTYWENRGCQGGSPEEDWLRAERELRSRAKSAGA
jgi:hypothetical protein